MVRNLILSVFAAITLFGCQQVVQDQSELVPLVRAKNGRTYSTLCLKGRSPADMGNCEVTFDSSRKAVDGLETRLRQAWGSSYYTYFAPYYNYYSTYGYYSFIDLSMYSQSNFCGWLGWGSNCYSYFGYQQTTQTTTQQTSWYSNTCDQCLYNLNSSFCWSYCYVNCPAPTPLPTPTPPPTTNPPPTTTPVPSQAVRSVKVIDGKLDGAVRFSLSTDTGILRVWGTQTRWTPVVKISVLVQTDSQTYSTPVNAGQAGTAVQLPGDWSRVRSLSSPRMLSYSRLESGNPPTSSSSISGTAAILDIDDGCCGRPSGIFFDADFNVGSY